MKRSPLRRHLGLQLLVILALMLPGRLDAASALKPDETLLLYPALLRVVPGGWEMQLHGAVYETEKNPVMTRAIRRLLGFESEDLTPAEAAIFSERCRWFLVDNERRKRFRVFLGEIPITLGRSEANGHFRSKHLLKGAAGDALGVTNGHRVLKLALNSKDGPTLPLEAHVLSETGWSVISDIDDTIKISEVRDREALLKNTFCRPFKPVPGMAGVYQGWAARHGAQFHYVTASPWQLYLPLSDFVRSNRFPAGTFHMKTFRVKDSTVLDLLASPQRYKPGVIEPLLRQFPQRHFVLVGDSGEKDPEIYASLARSYPNQIQHILIRDVTGEHSESPRYVEVFRGIGRDVWRIFTDPRELEMLSFGGPIPPKPK